MSNSDCVVGENYSTVADKNQVRQQHTPVPNKGHNSILLCKLKSTLSKNPLLGQLPDDTLYTLESTACIMLYYV